MSAVRQEHEYAPATGPARRQATCWWFGRDLNSRPGDYGLKKTKLQKIKKNKNKALEVVRDHKLTRKTAQNQGLRVGCVLVSEPTRGQVSSLISRALGMTAL
jgi:hypothetical protein